MCFVLFEFEDLKIWMTKIWIGVRHPILGRFLPGMITTTPLPRTTKNDNNNNDAFQLPLFRGTCSFCGVYYSKPGFFYTPFIVFHDPLHPDEASIWGFDCKDGYHGSLSGASSVGCLCFEEKSNGFFEDFQREGWGVGWTVAFLTSQKKVETSLYSDRIWCLTRKSLWFDIFGVQTADTPIIGMSFLTLWDDHSFSMRKR